MKEISEQVDKLNHFLNVELNAVEPVDETKLSFLKSYYSFTHEPGPMFHNSVNLVLTDKNDFDQISNREKDLSVVANLELKEFNVYLYILSIVNTPKIKNLFS